MNSREAEQVNGITRRTVLGALGLGGLAAILGSCEADGNSNRLMTELPDPLSPPPSRRILKAEKEVVPPTPTAKLPPPKTPSPPDNYGILPRSAWARGGPDMARIEPMNGVKLITFHHSGDPKPFATTDYAETAQHLEYVREYHRSQNFKDIGYHFAIDRAGRVWQLRGLAYEGQHVSSRNENNVGVVVLGNFEIQSMSAAQKEKIKSFGSLLRKQYALPISRLVTHQEIKKTLCPGKDMQPFMVTIRKQGLV